MGMRILLLMSIAWMTRLTAPLFTVMVVNRPISGRDLILIVGGLFLLFKATREIHDKLEGEEGHVSARVAPTLAAVITQIMLLDIVFSLDSVITAVGMADDLSIMVAAVVIAVAIMMFAARPVSEFVDAHPTVKVLALSFLLLIGCSLIADGFGVHIPKGYVYFAMGFSVFVEMINLRAKKKGKAVKLHDGYHAERLRIRTEGLMIRCFCDPGRDRVLDVGVHHRLIAAAGFQHRERVIAALDGKDLDRRRRRRVGERFGDLVGTTKGIARALHDQGRHGQRLQMRDAIAGAFAARRRQRIAEGDHARRNWGLGPLGSGFHRRPERGARASRDAWRCGRPSTCRR